MEAVLIQHMANWLVLGSIYTLIALGYSLLFGVLNVIHFSHGDVSMIAPFIVLALIQALIGTFGQQAHLIFLLSFVVALCTVGLIAIVIDWLVIRRFRGAPAMMALVATVALGTVVRELIRAIYPQGSNPKAFSIASDMRLDLGAISLSAFSLIIIISSILMVLVLYLIMQHTRIGMRIRAVSQDRAIARLMGIRPNIVFAFTFFIATAIGSMGAIFFASHAGVVRFDFGIQLGLIGFSAAVIGGLGSMPGAILGSMLIAAIETFVQATLADGASYRLVLVFVLVIAVLVVRPSGILGKIVFEKV